VRPAVSGEARILLDLLLVLLAAKVGGELAERVRQPAVLGEILAGVLLGPSLLTGILHMPHLDDATGRAEVLVALAELGAVLLLFEVGLETDVRAMAKVGMSSLAVAFLGIAVSFAAGYGFSLLLSRFWEPWAIADAALPGVLLHVLVGAALTATSVGITARVLGDLGRLRTAEARIVLGAAVLDDVGGLLILSGVSAAVAAAQAGGELGLAALGRTAAIALGFLAVVLAIGLPFAARAHDWVSDRLRSKGAAGALAVLLALGLAWGAGAAGLAPIVGAFVAGLLLARSRHVHGVTESLKPVASLFVGFFFVTLGMRVDVGAFGGHGAAVAAIGLGLSVVAILSKLTCGLGVLRGEASRWPVAVGMAPRGEVGLIFAALGLTAGVLAPWQYAILVVVALLTTLVTPPWLKALRGRFHQDADGRPDPPGQDVAAAMQP
jgi:Kef-type K+ transport system membrane component KefB